MKEADCERIRIETAREVILEVELFKRAETLGSETQRVGRLIKRLRRQFLGQEEKNEENTDHPIGE